MPTFVYILFTSDVKRING